MCDKAVGKGSYYLQYVPDLFVSPKVVELCRDDED